MNEFLPHTTETKVRRPASGKNVHIAVAHPLRTAWLRWWVAWP
jgi:hypothetical protein